MVKKQLADFGIRQGLRVLRKDPDKAIPLLLDGMDKLSRGTMPSQRRTIRTMLEDRESNVYRLLMRGLGEIDPDVFERVAANFILNVSFGGWSVQEELRERYNCNIPWAILLDPTSACNLHCKGCWAADYGNRLNLDIDTIDSVVEQGVELVGVAVSDSVTVICKGCDDMLYLKKQRLTV